MSLKLCKNRTETRSWRPKWLIISHYLFNMRNIWKTGPDRPLPLKNVQFQVGIHHKKLNLIKIKMADRQF